MNTFGFIDEVMKMKMFRFSFIMTLQDLSMTFLPGSLRRLYILDLWPCAAHHYF